MILGKAQQGSQSEKNQASSDVLNLGRSREVLPVTSVADFQHPDESAPHLAVTEVIPAQVKRSHGGVDRQSLDNHC